MVKERRTPAIPDDTPETRRVGKYYPYQLESSNGRIEKVKIKFTTEWANSGVQGYVRPAIMKINRGKIPVQVKRFYLVTHDDHPEAEDYTQNPNEETVKSLGAYKLLEPLGFKVLPLYAIATDIDGNKFIVMSDLREGGRKEAYDEKHLHHDRRVQAVVEGLENVNEIRLEILKTYLLSLVHNIEMSFPGGTDHMIVRDPETNKGDVWVVDIGHTKKRRSSEYEIPMDYENLIAQYPEDDVVNIYSRLLSRYHPDKDAKDLYSCFRKGFPKRQELAILFYKTAIGLAVRDQLGGWSGEEDWTRKRYVRSSFPRHFLRVKSLLYSYLSALEGYTGVLFGVGQEVKNSFVNAENKEDLFSGINFAELAVLDSVVCNLIRVRECVDKKESWSASRQDIEFDGDGFPVMKFFDNYNESKGEVCTVTLLHRRLGYNQALVEIDVELPWREAREAMTGGSYAGVYFSPFQIKSLRINGSPVENLDPAKVVLYKTSRSEGVIKQGDIINYVYNREVFYFFEVNERHDVTKIRLVG